MEIPTCQTCSSSLYREQEPLMGEIIVCDQCAAFYQVIQTNPLRMQLLGNTGQLAEDSAYPSKPN